MTSYSKSKTLAQAAVSGSPFYLRHSCSEQRPIAIACTGYDLASFYDSDGNDKFRTWWNRALMSGDRFSNEARDFERIEAHRTSGGVDRAFLDAVDYVFELIGGWS